MTLIFSVDDTLPWLFLKTSVALLSIYVVYSLGVAVYNVTLHPLRDYPGPKFRAAFHFPEAWAMLRGTAFLETKALHDEHGSVVRVAPNVLSYISAQAWKDIYSLKPDRTELNRDTAYYKGGPALLAASPDEHRRLRKLLAPGFSDGALLEQEPLLTVYFDLLVRKLQEEINGPAQGKVNIMAYYNFTTFDIIADLVLGEAFGALQSGQYHFWIRGLFEFIKFLGVVRFAMTYPALGACFKALAKLPQLTGKGGQYFNFSRTKVEARMALGTDRKDITSNFIRANPKSDLRPLTTEEITSTSGLLLVAGSETSATNLGGLTWFLLNDREALKRATAEVRAAFKDPSEITLRTVSEESRMPFVNAAIQETLRLYPSVPVMIPRVTRPGGDIIDGKLVPEHVNVSVHPYSCFHSPSNFTDPETFHPERWLPTTDRPSKFQNDNETALQAFSMGPKNCPGKSLAYFEIRSVIARILWQFDIKLANDQNPNWMRDQKEFLLWDKAGLWVQLENRNDL